MQNKIILAIYGAGGLGKEVYEIAKHINNETKKFKDIIFIDDINPARTLRNREVISFFDAINKYSNEKLKFVIAVGEPALRKKLYDKILDNNYELITLIHPSIYIPDTTHIGSGVVITEKAFISCDVSISDNVYIHPFALIGHDIKIGKHSVISASVPVGGAVSIGDCSYIGMASTIKEKLTIGSNAIIGMGSVVYNDIPDGVIALGNPARIMRKNEDQKIFK